MSALTLRPAATPLDLNWRLQGQCLGEDPNHMHPDPSDKAGEQYAKAVCRGCPVAQQCLRESFDLRDWHGVRAGLTGTERRNLAGKREPRWCVRCNDVFVPRLDNQVRCRPCASFVDGNRVRETRKR
ncbi:WhiB family transcriptional regulator [Micromonospora krabiensis]|uniref:Transcription factor WhiB n=1 Tax=Micromonospora krabiensis TaxID=307121 RepID=A0A1C3N4P7_9ACTN|nr:WhiB family transcriptional regulator [Micromonospora krabiensis]SBV27538.1 Transcription factor WhiB [Micromonospora krabiensis]